MFRLVGPLLLLALLIGCSPRVLVKPYDAAKIQRYYTASIGDAAKPQPWEITDRLTPIVESNDHLIWREIDGERYLLVSSWKADTTYYKNDPITGTYNTGNYPIWITVAPEVQDRCRNERFGRREGLDLRLKQLFGLPPDAQKAYFVEFWVRPADLFRPCPDPDVDDRTCGLAFPAQADSSHIAWINRQRIDSYYHAEWNKNYPWTELGYTYDWHPRTKDHIGLSEFVIGSDKEIIVAGFYSTIEYCTSD